MSTRSAHGSAPAILDLTAIAEAQLQTEPFRHLVVRNCIAADDLARINADFPEIARAGNLSLNALRYGPVFADLIRELESPAVAGLLGTRFDEPLAGRPTTVTVRGFCERSDGKIHTDHPSKVLSVLLYFNTEWRHAGGRLRLLRRPDDIEDYAVEVPPVGGTLLAFLRTPSSWHGHLPFVGARRMLQMNYLRSDPLSRLRQRVDRFGTRLGKRALRLVRGGAVRQ